MPHACVWSRPVWIGNAFSLPPLNPLQMSPISADGMLHTRPGKRESKDAVHQSTAETTDTRETKTLGVILPERRLAMLRTCAGRIQRERLDGSRCGPSGKWAGWLRAWQRQRWQLLKQVMQLLGQRR